MKVKQKKNESVRSPSQFQPGFYSAWAKIFRAYDANISTFFFIELHTSLYLWNINSFVEIIIQPKCGLQRIFLSQKIFKKGQEGQSTFQQSMIGNGKFKNSTLFYCLFPLLHTDFGSISPIFIENRLDCK